MTWQILQLHGPGFDLTDSVCFRHDFSKNYSFPSIITDNLTFMILHVRTQKNLVFPKIVSISLLDPFQVYF